jgi:REJ domain
MGRVVSWVWGAAAAACLSLAVAASPAQAGEGGKHSLRLLIHGVKKKVKATDGINLSANVNWRGPKATFKYRWSSELGPALPYSTKRDQKKLVVKAGELEEGGTYELRLTVVASWPDPEEEGVTLTAEATSDVTIAVNTPPKDGDCTIDVTWHGPAQAQVTIEAPSWSDDDKLQYKYVLIRNGNAFVAYSWSRRTKYALGSLAKPGDELQAKCLVRDDYGAITEKLSKKVRRSE